MGLDQQQALKQLIIDLKTLSLELGLDFDLALDHSDIFIDIATEDCDHTRGFPCGGDSLFCPNCNNYIIEGTMGLVENPFINKNVWRE